MRELQQCGCNSCREDYYTIEREQYRYRPDLYREIAKSAALGMGYGRSPMMDSVDRIINPPMIMKEPKVEKPITNPAIKLLADRLKTVDTALTSEQDTIDSYKKTLADAGKRQEERGKEKAALTKALKKLGHKAV